MQSAYTAAGVMLIASIVTAQPIPTGSSTVTVSYETAQGEVSFSGERAYLPDAAGPTDATSLGAAPNIRAFNATNSFGRRTTLANSNPQFQHVLDEDETLITHAFFKNIPTQLGEVYFPDLVPDGLVTITIGPIEFATPVEVDRETLMLHALWNGDQVDQLPLFYINLHNHHTAENVFRDMEDFINGGVFSDFPVANYVLGDVSPVISGSGTNTLHLTFTFPYAILENLEEAGQTVPGNLPAPQGFLEPFHIHVEYVVREAAVEVDAVPLASFGSATAMQGIILLASLFVLRRRHKSAIGQT